MRQLSFPKLKIINLKKKLALKGIGITLKNKNNIFKTSLEKDNEKNIIKPNILKKILTENSEQKYIEKGTEIDEEISKEKDNDMYNKVISIDKLSNNSPIFKEYLKEMKKDRGSTLETIDEDDINNNKNFQNFFVELTQKDFFPKNKIKNDNNIINKNILNNNKIRNYYYNHNIKSRNTYSNLINLNSLKMLKTSSSGFSNKNIFKTNIFFKTNYSNENSAKNLNLNSYFSSDSFNSTNYFQNVSPINSLRSKNNSFFNLNKRSMSLTQINFPGNIKFPNKNRNKKLNEYFTHSQIYKSFERKKNINLKFNFKNKSIINNKIKPKFMIRKNRCLILEKIRENKLKFQKEIFKEDFIKDNIIKMLDKSIVLFNRKKK